MKITSQAFLYALCVNVFITMAFMAGTYPSLGLNPGQNLDPQLNKTISTYQGTTATSYGDPVAAMWYFWQIFEHIVLGLGQLLADLGAPTSITWGIGIIWESIFVTKIIEVIRGGSFFD